MSNTTIICVDDEHSVLFSLKNQLRRYFPDYTIEIAESGTEALALVDEILSEGLEIPLVIADQIMPGMKGDELLIELHNRHPDILSIMLTGQARGEEVGNALNRGNLYRFIAKPWNETDLQLTVTQALRSYQQQQQITQQQIALEQANRKLEALNANLEQQVKERTEQLRRNESKLKETERIAQLGGWELDLQSGEEYWSEEIYSIHELPIDSSRPRYLENLEYYLNFYAPEARPTIQAAFQNAMLNGEAYDLELPFITAKGNHRWVKTIGAPILENGVIIKIKGILKDISDRKRAEITLQSLVEGTVSVTDEEFFLTLTRHLVEALDVENAILSQLIDGRFHTMAFWSAGQFLPNIIYSPEDASACAEVLESGIYSCPLDVQILHPENRYLANLKAESYLGVVLRGKDGQPIGHLCLIDTKPMSNQNYFLNILQLFASRAATELERQRISKALQESESQLQSLFAAMDDLVFVISRTGTYLKIIATNSAQLLYRSCEELLNHNISEFFPSEQVEIFLNSMQIALETQQTQECEYSLPINGTQIWFNANCSPLTEESVLWVCRDISDRKRAEITLQESEQRYVSLAEASPALIFRTDTEGNCLYVNERWCKMTGLSLAEALGSGWMRALHPSDRQYVAAQWQIATENQSIFRLEYRFQRVDGQVIWVYTQAVPEYTPPGDLIGYVGAVTDITERKVAQTALWESQARLQRLTANVTGMIYQYVLYADGSEAFTYVSPRCREIYELEPEELLRDFGQVWAMIHPEDREKVHQTNLNSAQQLEIFDIEFRLLPPSGCLRWVRAVSQPERQANGDVIWDGFVLDITARKQAELALQSLLQGTASVTGEDFLKVLAEQIGIALDISHVCVVKQVGECLETLVIYYDGQFHANITYEIAHTPCEQVLEKGIYHCSTGVQSCFALDELLVQMDVESYMGIALKNTAGETLGILSILNYQAIPQPERAELLLSIFAARAAVELERLQVWQELETLNQQLEQRVQERAQELQKSEARYRTLIEITDTGYLILDSTGKVLDANAEYIRLTGYQTLEQIQGRSVIDWTAPYDVERNASEVEKCFQFGLVKNLEIDYIAPDEQITPIEINANVIVTEQGLQILALCRDISDRKRAEAQLQQSQQFAQSIAENTPNIIYIYDLSKQRNLYCNQEIFSILGYTVEEIKAMGTNVLPLLIHPDDWSRVLYYQEKIASAKDDEIIEQEYRMLHADGSWRYLSDRVSVFKRDGEGRVIQYIGAAIDMSDRKQAEIALKESEERFRITFEQAAVGMVQADLEGRFVRMNQKFCDIVGYSEAELLSKPFSEITHPDDITEDQAKVKVLLAGIDQTFVMEKRYLRPDGEIVWANLSVSLVRNLSGESEYFIAAIEDISDRKRAEEKLKDSEERLRLAMTAANQGLYDLNLQTGEAIVSPQYAIMLGHDPNQFQETNANWLKRLHPEDTERVTEIYQAYVRGASPNYIVEFRQRTQDGNWKWILSVGKIVAWDESGQPLRMLGTHTDISDRKQAEEALLQINSQLELRVEERTAQLKQAKEAAEAANRAKSTFLANMSHELRTPLNAILGFSQLMVRHESLIPEHQEQIGIINRSGEYLLNLINGILEMSKIEAGHMTLNSKTFDLYNLLKTLEEMFRFKTESKDLQLIIERNPAVCQYVKTDESKLRQVLINLLSNAIKFTEKGSVTLRIAGIVGAHGVRPDGGDTSSYILSFEVEDTGPGIDPSEQNLLFEPFVQTQTGQKSQEGTGLGLPISRQFVQLMGGELTFHSIPGQGSTFKFNIPVHPVETSNLPNQQLNQQVIGLSPDQPKYRLLIAEDIPGNRQFLVQLLQELGFEVREAENGQEALKIWQSWSPDLIWMDMRMPVMNGYEATKKIREIEKAEGILPTPNTLPTKIIALTASVFEEERAEILASGCDDLVSKPATQSLILEKLAQYLGVRYLYKEQTLAATINEEKTETVDLTAMSSEWIEKLHQAAKIADEELILQLITEIPPEQAFVADQIRKMLNDFHLDKIIDLTMNYHTNFQK